ncbi:MAG: phytanoyl-CoA dioxygenase family protein [Acidimicrobiales bacterium]
MGTLTIGPPPPSSFEVGPSREQVEFFAENGYLVVDRITTDEEIDWLTQLYEHIFSPANADEPGAPVARSNDPADGDAPGISQAFFPEMYYPEVLETTFNRNARRYAAALLGAEIEQVTCWGHMIRKLPGGREAPWHQDEAYWEPELAYQALGCWLPLHEVTEEMGAMQFVPGSHRGGVLSHRPRDGDVALHVLEAEADTTGAVACPLPAGGATFHHSRTLHYTAPNTTGRPRLAFPTEFEVKPRFLDEPLNMPWVDAHRALKGRGAPTHYVADGHFVRL